MRWAAKYPENLKQTEFNQTKHQMKLNQQLLVGLVQYQVVGTLRKTSHESLINGMHYNMLRREVND